MIWSKWSHILSFFRVHKVSFEQSILESFSKERSNLQVYGLQKFENQMAFACLQTFSISHSLGFLKYQCVVYF